MRSCERARCARAPLEYVLSCLAIPARCPPSAIPRPETRAKSVHDNYYQRDREACRVERSTGTQIQWILKQEAMTVRRRLPRLNFGEGNEPRPKLSNSKVSAAARGNQCKVGSPHDPGPTPSPPNGQLGIIMLTTSARLAARMRGAHQKRRGPYYARAQIALPPRVLRVFSATEIGICQ